MEQISIAISLRLFFGLAFLECTKLQELSLN